VCSVFANFADENKNSVVNPVNLPRRSKRRCAGVNKLLEDYQTTDSKHCKLNDASKNKKQRTLCNTNVVTVQTDTCGGDEMNSCPAESDQLQYPVLPVQTVPGGGDEMNSCPAESDQLQFPVLPVQTVPGGDDGMNSCPAESDQLQYPVLPAPTVPGGDDEMNSCPAESDQLQYPVLPAPTVPGGGDEMNSCPAESDQLQYPVFSTNVCTGLSAGTALFCEFKDCYEEVYIACPLCMSILCYDHKETDCGEHSFHNSQFITVVDEDGNEFQLEVELCNESDLMNVTEQINTSLVVGCESIPRKRRPTEWNRNVAKNNRSKGLGYLTQAGKTMPNRCVKPNPCKNCCK
jgi:hypothetical protein